MVGTVVVVVVVVVAVASLIIAGEMGPGQRSRLLRSASKLNLIISLRPQSRHSDTCPEAIDNATQHNQPACPPQFV